MLTDSIDKIRGIGDITLKKFNENNIYTKKDLINTFPKKYNVYKLSNNPYEEDYDQLISIRVYDLYFFKTKNNLFTLVINTVLNGKKIKCISYGKEFLKFKIKKDQNILIYGRYISKDNYFRINDIFFDYFDFKIELDYKLDINNSRISKAILDVLKDEKIDFDILPKILKEKYKLLDYKDYLVLSHFPQTEEDLRQVFRRKKYEEFLRYCLKLEYLNQTIKKKYKSKRVFSESKILFFMMEELPFTLTEGQKNAINDALNDIKSDKTMNRLIQGDVGSGKTIVALISAYATVLAGYQVAFLCPTEILAFQHFEFFKKMLKKLKIGFLSSSLKAKERKEILSKLENQDIDILIGTHSILNDEINYRKLGLLVVDEQHRFGVNQRSFLLNKYQNVDALYLSATPIPRTLGISQFADLSISSIETKISGRKDIKTKVLSLNDFYKFKDNISSSIQRGELIYAIVPLIEESDSELMDINSCKVYLQEEFPNANIALIHGKIKADEKEKIINDFSKGKYNILVSTTVIEVGIDIKMATNMLIFNAERFGLSTLHQLRGRIGRNDLDSYCYLISNKRNVERLKFMETNNDCFSLAEYDLKMRGPGDLFGTKQSGNFDLDLKNDYKIFECAKNDSKLLFEENERDNFKIIDEVIKDVNLKTLN